MKMERLRMFPTRQNIMSLPPTTRELRLYTDQALTGAIRSLERGNSWASRLHQLLAERERRKRKGIFVNAYQIKLPI